MNTQWRKDSFFNKYFLENWIKTCRRRKLDPYLITLTKINLKWINSLNVRSETVKLSEETIGRKNELLWDNEWLLASENEGKDTKEK